jgi:hypothetical protein
MVKFEFKPNMWINQDAPPSYRPAAPVIDGTTVGTNPAGANGGGTARSGRPLPVQAGGLASLVEAVERLVPNLP